ncbi:MAG TPA: TonB family protein [Pyrinomonadaceae bacterium]|nr:TonB family protein [Pyrinomonadaceae bacterium]
MRIVFSVCVSLLLSAVLGASAALAQNEAKTIRAGILNGKATNLPKPEYPESLRAGGIGGMVAVEVEIDEEGKVVTAQALTSYRAVKTYRLSDKPDESAGVEPVPVDPLLRSAAEDAAREATFSPTMLNGKPVRITGTIIYNFKSGLADADVPGGIAKADFSGTRISGGVLNGKATSLPKPGYPAAARVVGAEGSVSVQVIVNEDGYVIAASAVSGHPLLRAAAVAAAEQAVFAPTQLSGQPVKVSGVLTYNFVLPKKDGQ